MMLYAIAALLFLSPERLTSMNDAGIPCCECSAPKKKTAICLTPAEMRDHVGHLEPLAPTGLDLGRTLGGVLVLEIRFDRDGKVECVRVKSGHPIAAAAAVDAVQKWTFKPALSNGEPTSACGTVVISYQLSDKGSWTRLRSTH